MKFAAIGRRAVVQVALVAGLLFAVSCGGSSWDAAVDRANKDGKPLIIEFYADWCGPCKRFEKQVLSDAEVQERLQTVQFFRYDFDSLAGKHHAKRLGVRSVPTFIAVDPEGFPMGGLRGAASKGRFLDFLQWARGERERLVQEQGVRPAPR